MLQAMVFLHPERLPVILAGLLVLIAATAVLAKRKGLKTTLNVSVLRLVILLAVAFSLMVPAKTETSAEEFKPRKEWVFDAKAESSRAFLGRLRLAVEDGQPPHRIIATLDSVDARSFGTAVNDLGVPIDISLTAASNTQAAMLLGFDVPKVIQAGEPLEGQLNKSGSGEVTLTLDGDEIELVEGAFNAGTLSAGIHVLQAELSADGRVLQRIGAVVEVGPPPVVTAVGLSSEQLARARELLPNTHFRPIDVGVFSEQDLRDGETSVAAVICSVKSGAEMTSAQADALQMFVARGGGLFVTGDDAKQVVVKYISDDFKDLLPVILQGEKQDPPDDTPLEETPGIEEIAKVSLLFVIDRSTSMAAATTTGASRWSVAVKSLEGSLNHVAGSGDAPLDESLATRVGVMAFTLETNWLTAIGEGSSKRPVLQTFAFERDRTTIVNELRNLDADENFNEAGFNTDIYGAMEEAIEVMSDEPSSVRMIVMLTDGGDNPENAVKGKIHRDLKERAIANEINIVTVGIGTAFKANNPDSRAANRVLNELATKPEFVHLTNGETTPAIFVDSVSRAFKAYDQKKKEEEEERIKKREADAEPETVDVLPGKFPMKLTGFGAELFGSDAIPDPAPKVAWYARNRARKNTATAIELGDANSPAALSFRAHGLGRVAFWAAGTKEESLGEVASWAEFPDLFSASMKWLLPRATTELEFLGAATTGGIQLSDPMPTAKYTLRIGESEIPLILDNGQLESDSPLPAGPATVFEDVDGTITKLGHVFIEKTSDAVGRVELDFDTLEPTSVKQRTPVVEEKSVPDTSLILYAVIFFLMVLPFERIARRRQ
ncbi:MAG: vWA domain-containing protein [Planctomycetota bacterium]|jgi:hypothetical protein